MPPRHPRKPPAPPPVSPPARRPDQGLGTSQRAAGGLGAGFGNVIRARLVLISGTGVSGLFIYNPGGALIGSWVGAATTDPIDGVSVPNQIQVRSGDGTVTGTLASAGIQLSKTGGAFAAPFLRVVDTTLAAPNQTQMNAANIQMPLAQLNELAAAPSAGVGFGQLYADAAGWPATIDPQGMKGQLMAQQAADFTTHTVTQATSTQLSTAFSVPANDAEVGAVYELEAWGDGTNGSTVQTLSVELLFGGSQRPVGGQTFPTTGAINNPLCWRVTLRVACVTTGTSGTWLATTFGELSAQGATALSNVLVVSTTSAFTLSTAAAQTLQLNANWGSTTGAPTVTCRVSQFRRVA